eukprot:2789617-Rhodomonas_salina.1
MKHSPTWKLHWAGKSSSGSGCCVQSGQSRNMSIIGYTAGVVSILGVIYYFILIRFNINVLDPSTHDLVCSRAK